MQTVPPVTTLRRRLRANGYSPVPNIDKECRLKNWPHIEITPEVIDDWATQYPRWTATGVRVEQRLIAVDIDIDDARLIDGLYDEVCRTLPFAENAPIRRTTASAKEMWFFRLKADEPLFRYLGSTGHVRPGEDPDLDRVPLHRVEVWGGLGARQIGCFGPHKLDRGTGEVVSTYTWLDKSLEDTPLAALPEITQEQLTFITTLAGTILEAAGWPRALRVKPGFHAGEIIYDLDDTLEFRCNDGVARKLADLVHFAKTDDPRCSASWLEGPAAVNTSRCLIALTHDGNVLIHETASSDRHMAVTADQSPARGAARLAEKLKEKGLDPADTEPDAPTAFNDEVRYLLTHYAFDESRAKTCLPLFGSEEKAATLANLRAARQRLAITVIDDDGKKKRVNPVDRWLSHTLAIIQPLDYRFAPQHPLGLIEEDGERFINSYRPIIHPEITDPACEAVWLDFIAHLLPHEIEREWFLDWLAYKLQNLHVPSVACVMVSGNRVQGTGRGVLMDILQAVVGKRYVSELKAPELLGSGGQSQYNDWQSQKLFLFVEELAQDSDDSANGAGKRRKMYERLKAIVEPRPGAMKRITRKGLPNFDEQVCASFIIASNHANAMFLSAEDRRFCILRGTAVKLEEADEGRLFERLVKTYKIAGRFVPRFASTVWAWAQQRDVSSFNPMKAPEFEGKLEMQLANTDDFDVLIANSVRKWPTDWIDRASFGKEIVEIAEDSKFGGTPRMVRMRAYETLTRLFGQPKQLNVGTDSKQCFVYYTSPEAEKRVTALSRQEREQELGPQLDGYRERHRKLGVKLTAHEGGKK